VVRLQQV